MISDKRSVQQILAYLTLHGIDQVIISPGSRNGPLTYSFTQSEKFKCHSIVDERSAGFFALGMAQQLRKGVVLCCTSGTAVLNYAPAIAEAFYQRIPLIVLSADRPEEFLNNGIGQTIDQKNVFNNFSNCSVHLNGESMNKRDFDNNNDLLNKAFSKLIHPHPGPIHINVPLSEPLYNFVDQAIPEISLRENPIRNSLDLREIQQSVDQSNRVLILTGQMVPDQEFEKFLIQFATNSQVLVVTETTSNSCSEQFIATTDRMVFNFEESDIELFKPDIVLTIGTNIISKKIKEILRNHPPNHHWHIDPSGMEIDTFGCLSKTIAMDPADFLNEIFIEDRPSDYQHYHLKLNNQLRQLHHEFLNTCAYSDLKVFDELLESIPKGSMVQMGNSSVVRYIQLFDQRKDLEYHANRGTSGIDGSTSTALGAAYASSKPTTFITGDVAFFYDSNALWNDHIPNEFKIIIINNGGGGIFRIIPGPDTTGVMNKYFETHHQLNARHLAEMHEIQYLEAHNLQSLKIGLEDLYDSPHPKILEIFTPREENDKILKSYFKCLKRVSKPELTGEKLKPMRI